MDKVNSSTGAAASFSARALALAKGAKPVGPAADPPAKGALARQPSAAPGTPLPAASPARLPAAAAASTPASVQAALGVAPAGPLAPPEAARSAQAQAQAPAPSPAGVDAVSFSEEARALSGAGAPARTVDAGAPLGAGKRLRAYGDAQQALAPKGGGFDGSA